MKLDKVDMAIIAALRSDGRASLREIARRTSISTPTISSRLSRMMKSGLIRNFVPVFGTLDVGTAAIVTMEVPLADVASVSERLARMDKVSSVLVTAGHYNLSLRVNLESPADLQGFLLGLERYGRVRDSSIVTSIVKEEQPAPRLDEVAIKLKCNFCGGDITAPRPYTFKVGPIRYYFCCRTCRRSYLDKYSGRIKGVKSGA
jgi:Lrp/AsnC family transcriptional regulator for asnA, asnC and gidA